MTEPWLNGCACSCHAPYHDVWAFWCDDCDPVHAADLVQVARHELYCLWRDLRDAVPTASGASLSIRAEGIAHRIVALSRLVGVAPWEAVSVSLLRCGIYQRVHDAAGLDYPAIDWERVAAHETRIAERLERIGKP